MPSQDKYYWCWRCQRTHKRSSKIGQEHYSGLKDEDKHLLEYPPDNEEERPKEKQRIKPEGIERLLHMLGIHHWAPIYTVYSKDYKLPWRLYCVHCPKEKDNEVMFGR